ncbi:MAG: hypothetical protein J5685_00845 [Clostridiales bacterium]|nr:hypothetical protein [Clostridiales bacterium]
MEKTVNRDRLMLFAAGCLFFCAIERLIQIFTSRMITSPAYPGQFRIHLFLFLSLTILALAACFIRKRLILHCIVQSVVFLILEIDYFSNLLWLPARFVFALAVIALQVLNLERFKGKLGTVITRFGFLFICVFNALYTFISLIFRTEKTTLGGIFFRAAVLTVILASMINLLPGLKLFSKAKIWLLTASVIMFLITIPVMYSGSSIRSPFLKFLDSLVMIVLGLACVAFLIWSGKTHKGPHRISMISITAVFVISIILSVSYHVTLNTLKGKDIGVRQQRATNAYYSLFRQDLYNWGEISGTEDPVDTSILSGSVVTLDSDSIPVFFISGGMTSEVSGNTRIVFYDEENSVPYQVWGNMSGVSVRGYIRKDSGHEYPLIFCSGENGDVMYEMIYEIRGSELVLLAYEEDIYPYGTDEIIPPESRLDSYSWNGTQVGLSEYNRLRDEIIDGYTDIDWPAVD